MNFAERLKQVRESFHLSQKEMGKRASVSLQMWQAYEAGKSVPGGNVLEALARLGVNVNWLLTGSGEISDTYVGITKEDPKGFGRAKELSYKVYPGFGSRLKTKLGTKTAEWLAEASKLPLDTINSLLADKIPTVDELLSVAEALNAPITWLAEGDKPKSKEAQTIKSDVASIDSHNNSQFPLNEAGLDVDLMKYILGAVEIVSNDVGRGDDEFSFIERTKVIINLYKEHIKENQRPHVNLDRMIDMTLNAFFFGMPIEKLERLRDKYSTEPSNPLLEAVNYFIEMHKVADRVDKEVAMKLAERKKGRKVGDVAWQAEPEKAGS